MSGRRLLVIDDEAIARRQLQQIFRHLDYTVEFGRSCARPPSSAGSGATIAHCASASIPQIGLFEAAPGGTLFLDEVAETSQTMQVQLLRVLQEREVLRLGGRKAVPVDVRVVAASNRRLDAAVERGEMREDLYFRLNVVNLTLPPLRERRDDIPLLAYYFLKRHALAMGKAVEDFEPEVLDRLVAYDFPGNIRELSNVVERAVALSRGDRISVAELPATLRNTAVAVLPPTGEPLPTLTA